MTTPILRRAGDVRRADGESSLLYIVISSATRGPSSSRS